MPQSLAHSLGLKPEPSTAIPVRGIGGPTSSVGHVKAELTIGSLTLVTTFHVFEHATDVLIGNFDASRFKLVLKFTDNSIRQEENELIIINVANTEQLTKESFMDSLESRTIFADSVKDIGRITCERHKIRIKDDDTPIALRAYRFPEEKRKEVQRQVDELLQLGLVRESHSPWAFPVTLAKKKDGSSRLCIDYRALNAITSAYRQPLPLIPDLLDRVGSSRYFSTLDAVAGYWHIEMEPESIEKSAFITDRGHYEWIVMPFGLKNAPSTFQRAMQRILHEELGKGCEVYLDDVIIHTATEEEHVKLLSKVLSKLEAAGLRLKRKKCTFFATQIAYLGHLISEGELRPLPDKLTAINNFPPPTNVKELQSFVGLAGYYRDFVPEMSRLTRPLSNLTKKDVPYTWSEEHQRAFEEIKKRLTTEPVLAVFDPNLENELTTDASKDGLAAIFTQKQPDGRSRVISYWSRATRDAETRYAAVELEVLAVVESLERFRHFVEGKNVTIITDCAAIRWIKSFKDTNSRLFRWTMRLSAFTYTVKHRAGSSNVVADCLSRHPVPVNAIALSSVPLIAFESRQEELREYNLRLSTFSLNGISHVRIRNRNRILVPRSLIPDVLRSCHDDRNHCGTNVTHQLVSSRYWWPDLANDVAIYVKTCHACQVVKAPKLLPDSSYQPVEVPESPNDIWAMDTVVLGQAAAESQAKYVQVIVDHHSRYAWVFPTKSNNSEMITSYLSTLMNCVGRPRVLITDNATNFTSEKMETFLARSPRIEHRLTSTYHPAANGLCETTHHTITQAITLRLVDCQRNMKWSSLAKAATHAYNWTPHSVTGFPPAFLQFGHRNSFVRSLGINIDDARNLAVERTKRLQENRRLKYAERHKPHDLEVGNFVLHRLPSSHPDRDKLSPQFEGPYRFTEQNGPDSFFIERDPFLPRPEVRAHVTSLRKYHRRPDHLASNRN